jgi:predicted TIM-barrel fold metal-dependent hydrolase
MSTTLQKWPEYRRDTRAPVEMPPRGSCDCHVHVFDKTQIHRLRQGSAYDPPDATVDDLLRMHRTLGIDRGVIVQASGYGTDHEVMIEALAKAGSNYRGVAIINDSVTDAELARLHAAGVRAARFSFASFLKIAPTIPEFERGVARVRELGWHIKVFTVGDDLLKYADIFEQVDVPLVFDHMGFLEPHRGVDAPAFRRLIDFLGRDNCWVTISNGDRRSPQGYPWNDIEPFAQALIAAAPERVLWCTDWPHLTYEKIMPNDAELLEFIFRCCPDRSQLHRILVDNPARLYGFI